jgi:hypothetical protein
LGRLTLVSTRQTCQYSDYGQIKAPGSPAGLQDDHTASRIGYLERLITDLPEGSMPFARVGWRIAIPAIVVFILVDVGAAKFVRDAYPTDPFKSEALAKCLAGDPGFIRFFADDRAKCYARQPRQTRLEIAGNEERQSN